MTKDKDPAKEQEGIGLPVETTPILDPFQGLGGRYVRDKKTGQRTRVQYTKRCAECKSIKKD